MIKEFKICLISSVIVSVLFVGFDLTIMRLELGPVDFYKYFDAAKYTVLFFAYIVFLTSINFVWRNYGRWLK